MYKLHNGNVDEKVMVATGQANVGVEISDPIMVTSRQIGRGSNFWPLAIEGTTMNYGSDRTGLTALGLRCWPY